MQSPASALPLPPRERLSYPVVCLQVVNLLLEKQCPQILAQELDHIQCVEEAWSIPGESGWKRRKRHRVSQTFHRLRFQRSRARSIVHRSPRDKLLLHVAERDNLTSRPSPGRPGIPMSPTVETQLPSARPLPPPSSFLRFPWRLKVRGRFGKPWAQSQSGEGPDRSR